MVIKDFFIKQKQEKQTPSTLKKYINLNNKVDNFIDWYANNIKGRYTEIGEYHFPNRMRNFIEKVAVWYELRYPEYEVNRLMHCCGESNKEANKIMFNNNEYMNDLFTQDAKNPMELEWSKFYNTKSFINSLPENEKSYFYRPKYSNLVYWNLDNRKANVHLTNKGLVTEAEFFNHPFKNKMLEGKHIKEVVEMLKEEKIKFPENCGFERAISAYDNWCYQKDEMLNCIMYRIIERGGSRIGPRRAFLFAKEFGRNIDIPMMYAIDYSDPGLRLFMNEYIKAGGSKDLICYIDYFSKINDKDQVKTVTVQELIVNLWLNAAYKYTEEENNLHERLVNALASKLNEKEEEEGKKLVLKK